MTSCTGVTATSWPMAMEPMEEAPQRLTGCKQAARFAGQLDAGARAESEGANVLVEAVGADLERELDGGNVAGPRKRGRDRNDAESAIALVVVNDAAGKRDLSALAVDHVVGRGDVLVERGGVGDELEGRARLVDIADGVICAAVRAWCGENCWD